MRPSNWGFLQPNYKTATSVKVTCWKGEQSPLNRVLVIGAWCNNNNNLIIYNLHLGVFHPKVAFTTPRHI